jgi:hypothetical protein
MKLKTIKIQILFLGKEEFINNEILKLLENDKLSKLDRFIQTPNEKKNIFSIEAEINTDEYKINYSELNSKLQGKVKVKKSIEKL